MWHCPHCGAPQAESARCWVCRRSSTTCSTCRNYRVSLAADVGFCALDRRRLPLTGLELRGCWAARPSIGDAAPSGVRALGRPARPPARSFVPIDEVVLRDAQPALLAESVRVESVRVESVRVDVRDAPTSLFGDAER